MRFVSNPIMPGFYPDPSICRVGSKYYMVHSTFAYFPGVPIFESEDLIRWKQIGNVLDRDSQIPLAGHGYSKGIYAPTIRYHQGTFYVITTNVPQPGNFIVTAQKPEGPWSEPFYLNDAPGIDPSLFFDEDGTCYYIGQRNKVGQKYYGDCEIWVQKLNLNTMQLEGDAVAVLDGFQKNSVWAEGPHLYRKDSYYYIIHAESGTSIHHAVVAARSRNVFGPYEYCPCNPILTHRHLGKEYPVTCVGHGDLVGDVRGNWYMVLLACRPQEGYTLLGRESFLSKVSWEDGWPVVNPGVGRLEETVEIPGSAGLDVTSGGSRTYAFDHTVLPPEFLTVHNHRENILSLSAQPGFVRLFMRADTLKGCGEPAYLALRQQHRYFEAGTSVRPHFSEEGGCAGIALVQNNENHLRAERYRENGWDGVRVIQAVKGTDKELACRLKDTDAAETEWKIAVRGLLADIWYRQDREPWQMLVSDIDLRPLSTEFAGGFVGCTVGMYASGNGRDAGGYADFAAFSYSPADNQRLYCGK